MKRKGCCNENQSTRAMVWKGMHGVKQISCCQVQSVWLNSHSWGYAPIPQPPLVQTQTVTITAVSNSLPSGISTTEVPVVPTKTFIYESSKVGAPAPAQPRSVSVTGNQFAWKRYQQQVWEDQAGGSRMNMRQHCTFPGWSSGLRYKKFILSFSVSQVTDDGTDDKDGTTVSSSKTVTSEATSGTTVTTTTTHISKVSSMILLFVYVILIYFICNSQFYFLFPLPGGEKRIFGDSCGKENRHNCRL